MGKEAQTKGEAEARSRREGTEMAMTIVMGNRDGGATPGVTKQQLSSRYLIIAGDMKCSVGRPMRTQSHGVEALLHMVMLVYVLNMTCTSIESRRRVQPTSRVMLMTLYLGHCEQVKVSRDKRSIDMK